MLSYLILYNKYFSSKTALDAEMSDDMFLLILLLHFLYNFIITQQPKIVITRECGITCNLL